MKKIIALLILAAGSLALMPAKTHAQTGKNEALESLGAISGMLVYNTYVGIGAIADGFSTDAYDAETVKSLMEEQQSAMTSIMESLDKLATSGFLTDPADKQYVNDAKDICNTLKTMAGHLAAYSQDKSTTNSDAFQASRTSAWKQISALLDFEE